MTEDEHINNIEIKDYGRGLSFITGPSSRRVGLTLKATF